MTARRPDRDLNRAAQQSGRSTDSNPDRWGNGGGGGAICSGPWCSVLGWEAGERGSVVCIDSRRSVWWLSGCCCCCLSWTAVRRSGSWPPWLVCVPALLSVCSPLPCPQTTGSSPARRTRTTERCRALSTRTSTVVSGTGVNTKVTYRCLLHAIFSADKLSWPLSWASVYV